MESFYNCLNQFVQFKNTTVTLSAEFGSKFDNDMTVVIDLILRALITAVNQNKTHTKAATAKI